MDTSDVRAATTVDAVRDSLRDRGYLADDGLATSILLALQLRRPLLLEGDAGVGKTEVAKVLADWGGSELIRLQCYEGIDVHQAVYEWDHARQLMHLRSAEATGELAGETSSHVEEGLYDERYLVRRPILRALEESRATPAVLLIDEIDRADDEFEAFLLEVLSEFAVTIPELGTIRAQQPPIVVLTSNRTRDLHDALKRRCLYHWVEHPDLEREIAIISMRAPDVSLQLATEVAGAAAALRSFGLYKPPGIAESIDWAESLRILGVDVLGEDSFNATLGSVVKYREDQARVREAGLHGVLASSSSNE
jgi:MoxR-like ATPase